jgi:hypothetical protein
MSSLAAEEIAAGVILLSVAAGGWVSVLRGVARRERAVLKEHARAIRARYAAIEASEDNPSYSPDAIEHSVLEVVTLANDLWEEGTTPAVGGRRDARLVKAWAKSCESRLGTGLEAVGKPEIDLLSVINRNDEEEDRIVVRVRLKIHCKHPNYVVLPMIGLVARRIHLDERWTFGRSGDRLVLLSVGGDPLAGPVLTAPLVPTPSSDTGRLREESLVELARAGSQRLPDNVALADLVSADEPPALALLDLSIVDPRFLPALITSELGHLLERWEGAVSGSEAPFEELASASARAALLRPGRRTRLVMRDAVLKSWEPKRLDLYQHPTIEVTLDVEAVRYVVNDDGSHLAGDETNAHEVALTWILELTDSRRTPWRLTTSSSPAEAIAGWEGFRPSAARLD